MLISDFAASILPNLVSIEIVRDPNLGPGDGEIRVGAVLRSGQFIRLAFFGSRGWSFLNDPAWRDLISGAPGSVRVYQLPITRR